MNFFTRILTNFFAAWAISVPKFERGKDETTESAPAPIVDSKHEFVVGAIEQDKQRQQKQYTIAGGPGSQKIGATFDALPAAERERMLLARKGIIRQLRPGEDENQGERPAVTRRSGTEAIAHALSQRYERGPGGKLQPKEQYRFDAEKHAKSRTEVNTKAKS